MSKLDGLTLDVHNLFTMIRGREQALRSEPAYPSLREDESMYIANLKNCASSAEQLVTTATEIVNSRSETSSQLPSFPKLSDEKVQYVEEWRKAQAHDGNECLASPATTFSEMTIFSERSASTGATSPLSYCESSGHRATVVDPHGGIRATTNSEEPESASPSIETEPTPIALRVDCTLQPYTTVTDRFEQFPEHLSVSLRLDDPTYELQKEGLAKYDRKDYAGAEICLEDALGQVESSSRESPSNSRTELLSAIASCCAHLGKVQRVEEILNRDEAPNEWKYSVLEMVLSRYLRDGMWAQSNELLVKYRKEFDGRDDALIRLLTDCRRNGAWSVASCIGKEYSKFRGKCRALEECVSVCQEGSRWNEAEVLMLDILKEKELIGDEIALSHTTHQLADILVHKKDYATAKQYCSNSLELRIKRLGKKHDLVRDSAYLLAKIVFKSKGEMGEYNMNKSFLPVKYQGINLQGLTVTLECLELELLMEMHPSQAAQHVGIRLLKSIAPETSSLNLETIRSSIKANGVVGLSARQNDTLLHVFAESGNEIAIDLLLLMGARPDTPSSSHITSLYLTIENDHEAAAKVLLEHGASIGTAELRLAVEKNRESLVRLLLEQGGVVETTDSRENALFGAATRGEIAMVHLLLQYRQGPKWSAPSMLYLTALNGHVAVVRLLLENGAIDSRAVSPDASPSFRNPARLPRIDTALHECVRQGLDEHIIKMMANPDNINVVDRNGETALHIAASRCFTRIVEILFERQADMNIRNFEGRTPLHCVVYHSTNDAADIVKRLLSRAPKLDEKDHQGNTPLHIALFEAKPPSYEILRTFLDARADLKATTRLSQSALSHAIKLGLPLSSELTSLLIDHDVDINELGREGYNQSDYERLVGTVTASKIAQRLSRNNNHTRRNSTQSGATSRQPSRKWGRPVLNRKTTI
jgi:ankyrin repeat protein/tetratricopeptide (TPR) repeat protein